MIVEAYNFLNIGLTFKGYALDWLKVIVRVVDFDLAIFEARKKKRAFKVEAKVNDLGFES